MPLFVLGNLQERPTQYSNSYDLIRQEAEKLLPLPQVCRLTIVVGIIYNGKNANLQLKYVILCQ